MNTPPIFLILGLCAFLACQSTEMKLQKLDLQPYDLPIVIMAPDSAVVQKKDYSFMKDITIKKGDDYFIQIFEFTAPKLDAAGEKLRQLASVREDTFFREIIKEYDRGFIYSRQADTASTALVYDFRYIRILDGKELIFQTGLVGSFSLEEVRTMYKAVSNE